MKPGTPVSFTFAGAREKGAVVGKRDKELLVRDYGGYLHIVSKELLTKR